MSMRFCNRSFSCRVVFHRRPLSGDEKKFFSARSVSRANLPEADKAGGEYNALTYPQSKPGTISIAEGLM